MIILSPPKKRRMEFTNQVNRAPLIKIEQLVKHDVWDIRKKDDGAFVMKKLNEDNTGAHANFSGLGINVGPRTNPEQSGARPKITVQMPKKNNGFTMNAVNTPKNEVVTINTVAARSKDVRDVITINAAPPPKREVVTLNMPTVPKKEVITMKTTTAPKMEVITINTEIPPKNKEEVLSSQVKNNFSVMNPEQLKRHGIWNIHNEACRIHEMFPAVPLNVISDDLKNTGSVEITIENILDGKLVPPVSAISQNLQDRLLQLPNNTASSSVSPVVRDSDKEGISQQSTETEKKLSDRKKVGTVIKIEFLAQNEVWDIKKKDKEGYVMKKVTPGDDSHSQNNKSSCTDNFTEAMEEESDEVLLADDIFIDGIPYKANPEEMNDPVKIMVYSQSSSKNSPVSKRRAIATANGENTETSMEIDNLNNSHLCQGGKVALDSFDFSDDENEEHETVEHFLFKASLVLKKLKYLNEAENQKLGDSALLKITGSVRNEEEIDSAVAEGGCSDDEYYTDEYCTDEED